MRDLLPRRALLLLLAVGCDDAETVGQPLQLAQEAVVCTGWHALCTAAHDCRTTGDHADCDCARVHEDHIVETASIQDAALKRRTREACTTAHPCDTDEAPVCGAIRDGTYTVDGAPVDWVSTYSYRGWCGILEPAPVPCDPRVAGYDGDRAWAVCDGAPCAELTDPPDPTRPLRCRCRVQTTPFVGPGGRCRGDDGGLLSSFPLEAWDFERGTYRIPMPGYGFVQGACAPLTSDP